MSIQERKIWLVYCDRCGETDDEPSGGLDTMRDGAATWVAYLVAHRGWKVTPDPVSGRHLCPDCATRACCAGYGHKWVVGSGGAEFCWECGDVHPVEDAHLPETVP